MCNYNAGHMMTVEDILWQVKCILHELGPRPFLYLSPLGSMFDDEEMPAAARRAIFELVREMGCELFSCETRADTITDAKIAEFRAAMGSSMGLSVVLGLESANPWVRKNCINKCLAEQPFREALDILHRYDIGVVINILLAPPFLSEREAIEDAVRSIEWAASLGKCRLNLALSTVKPYTLVHWLWQRGLYQPPKLWSALKVLRSIGSEYLSQTTVIGYSESTPITRRPSTCHKCDLFICDILREYRSKRELALVDAGLAYDCACRHEWANRIVAQEAVSLPERVRNYYAYIGREMFGNEWWQENQEWVAAELQDGISSAEAFVQAK